MAAMFLNETEIVFSNIDNDLWFLRVTNRCFLRVIQEDRTFRVEGKGMIHLTGRNTRDLIAWLESRLESDVNDG